MHELALASELLALVLRVARDEGALRVTGATLELGELSCVDPETLSFAFEVSARGGPAEGCRLDVRRRPLVVSCPACGREGPADRDLLGLGCPGCGALSVEVLSGREMRLASVTVEDDHARP